MATKKLSVSPEKPITQPVVKSKNSLSELFQAFEKACTELEGKKQLALTDENSKSDFHNLHRDAEQHKTALKEYFKYLEG